MKEGFTALENYLCDQLEEQQMKLGYRNESVHLYVPLSSLNRLLHTQLGAEEMAEELVRFRAQTENYLGHTGISRRGDRFGLTMKPEASEYVHTVRQQSQFLRELISLVSDHGVTLDDVGALFGRYSGRVASRRFEDGEFDLLLYFEDGIPDEYRYCFSEEGGHVIYHRFSAGDYEEMYGKA